jgi:hypothetical protein
MNIWHILKEAEELIEFDQREQKMVTEMIPYTNKRRIVTEFSDNKKVCLESVKIRKQLCIFCREYIGCPEEGPHKIRKYNQLSNRKRFLKRRHK